ncbi:MAG: YARHG domain-containing protein [Ignavibacteria bacterium]|nr:YARHG domain-containing protein [Bacteroidota bacterium]MBL7127832.1 YARHG domain-containing protein [Ignavibacteria bacterium]
MKFIIALLIAIFVLACGLLDKDEKDSSDELKKKELELKERELALKEKEKDEKEERIMKQREERLSREKEDLSTQREYVEKEERRNRDNQTRTKRQRVETDYSNYQPGLYPETSTRYLNYDDIRNKSKWQLKIMRNEIYARYGYIFKTKDMKNYFNNQSWYNPVYSDVSGQLTSLEKRNVAFIKKYE